MCFAAISWARLDRLTFAASREEAARAGFDDARLYRELARPLEERELETRRLLEEEASASFEPLAGQGGPAALLRRGLR